MISAVILAAGESKRMGEQNKLLLPFRGQTLIECIVDTVLSSNVGEVIVVLGHEAVRVWEVCRDRHVKCVQNDNYKEGMTTSIHMGVQAADASADGFMICLSDLPLIEPDELNHLLHAFESAVKAKNKYIAISVFEGQRGNPVIFSSIYKDEILAYKGLMGCKEIIQQNSEQVLEVGMATNHVLRDIDTPEDYKELFKMQNTSEYTCAYCGETNLTFVDLSAGAQQSDVEDCQVCCQPNVLYIQLHEETLEIEINSEPES